MSNYDQPTPGEPSSQASDSRSVTRIIELGVYYPSSASLCSAASHTPEHSGKYGVFYSRRTSKTFGVLLVCLSSISVTGGTFALLCSASGSWLATGFWCGGFYAVSAFTAISAAKQASDKLIAAVAIAAILDVAFGITQMTISLIGIDYDITCYPGYGCATKSTAAVSANCMTALTGLWACMIGISLLFMSIGAMRKGSKSTTNVRLPLSQPTASYAAQQQTTTAVAEQTNGDHLTAESPKASTAETTAPGQGFLPGTTAEKDSDDAASTLC